MEAAGLALHPHALGEWVSLVACTNLTDPAGSPEQCKDAPGTPKAESDSSTPAVALKARKFSIKPSRCNPPSRPSEQT